ncbi:MAG: 3-methyl-2-oxobutanoate hydroxymethyltransferase, partial [Methyloceanibacter sp.]
RAVSETLAIPTVGIGAGPHCDGQVLVVNDLLGVTPRSYRHNRRYQEFGTLSAEAVSAYCADVVARRFPTGQNGFAMNQGEAEQLQHALETHGERSRA